MIGKLGMDRVHLKWKIFMFLLGFCGLLLVILWLFQTVFLSDMYKAIRMNEIEEAVSVVEKNINSVELDSILKELEHDSEIMVMKTDEFQPQFREGKGGPGKPKEEILTKTEEFVRNDGTVLSLTFHAMITPVNATVATLQIQLYIITGIMIALSVGLALIIARRVSKPIEDINSSAKELAKGNYQVWFTGKGFLEIAELSQTMNTAASDLSKVEELRRELMANISHDLRTPLSLIYSYAEMMHDFPEEITQEQTEVIMEETNRLSSLVNDVFEISKLETGTMVLNRKEFNITESVGAVIKRLEELLKKDGFSFVFQPSGELCITADEVKLEQVLYNLLINAVNYSKESRKIVVRQKITTGDAGEIRVRIEVEDQGEGIAAEKLPFIWDRYYKAEATHRRAVTGTGLGLSIVKKIVALHGGNCGVESMLGEGSLFWFEI